MKVKYLGKDYKGLEHGHYYDIEFNATPRFVWVDVNGIQKTYINLTYFALDWDIIDKDMLMKADDEDYKMRQYIEKMNKMLP